MSAPRTTTNAARSPRTGPRGIRALAPLAVAAVLVLVTRQLGVGTFVAVLIAAMLGFLAWGFQLRGARAPFLGLGLAAAVVLGWGISHGIQDARTTSVPEVVGQTPDHALDQLKEAHLGEVTMIGNEPGAAGCRVTSAQPAVGADVAKGAPVTLRVTCGQ